MRGTGAKVESQTNEADVASRFFVVISRETFFVWPSVCRFVPAERRTREA